MQHFNWNVACQHKMRSRISVPKLDFINPWNKNSCQTTVCSKKNWHVATAKATLTADLNVELNIFEAEIKCACFPKLALNSGQWEDLKAMVTTSNSALNIEYMSELLKSVVTVSSGVTTDQVQVSIRLESTSCTQSISHALQFTTVKEILDPVSC